MCGNVRRNPSQHTESCVIHPVNADHTSQRDSSSTRGVCRSQDLLHHDLLPGPSPHFQTCRSRKDRRRSIEARSEEHTSELQSPCNLVCRLLLEKKKQPKSDGLPKSEKQSQHAQHV